MEILRTKSLSIGYGEKVIVSDINATLDAGDMVALIGPNGAGKSTLFKTLSSRIKPVEGTIELMGKDLTAYSPNEKAKLLGIVLTERPDDMSSLTGSSIGSKALAFQQNFYRNGEKRKSKPKVTLLDFWATWCGPCRQTLPIVGRLYEKLSSRGFEVIGVSTEQLSVLEQFYKEHPSPYPLYRDATQEMNRRYGVSAIPTLMLLDENGYIQKVWPGVPSDKALEKAILEAMGK